jgi:glycosyltransferase involved in cell wall biosynthesis
MRYAWDQFDAYFGTERMGIARSLVLKTMMRGLAGWDRRTSGRPDRYVAISQYVAERIRRYYNREATIVYPPVDTDFYHPAPVARENYALVVSALVPYKRIDLAIAACERARLPLRIVGQGPEEPSLRGQAGPTVDFLGVRSNEDIRELYRRATVTLLPGEEDFGIVPLEAQACGSPVVALGRGGALETVVDEETGVLVGDATPDAFSDAIARVRRSSFDLMRIRTHAERFSRSRFAAGIQSAIDDLTITPGSSSW